MFRLTFIAFVLMWIMVMARQPGSVSAGAAIPAVESDVEAALQELSHPLPSKPGTGVVEYWGGVVCQSDPPADQNPRGDCAYPVDPAEFGQ